MSNKYLYRVRNADELRRHDIIKALVAVGLIGGALLTGGAGSGSLRLADGLKMPSAPGPVSFNGFGGAGNHIELRDGTRVVGTATVNADGTWEMKTDLTEPLPKSLTFVEIGKDNGELAHLEQTLSASDSKFKITSPEDKSAMKTGVWTIEGTGEPGAEVAVFMDRWQLALTQVSPDGTWKITPKIQLGLPDRIVKAVDKTHNLTDTHTHVVEAAE